MLCKPVASAIRNVAVEVDRFGIVFHRAAHRHVCGSELVEQ
jgi:hypothetical protein